ncbi:MAG: T9SS type A sorting domain-containing protein [Bacteroidota bacterium]
MKKLLYIIAFLPVGLWGQSYLHNNGANVVIDAGTQVRVEDGGVVNQSGGEVTNEGNIYLDRDWTQTGATYDGGGWMWFEGTADQNVNATWIPRLRVDNGNRLILGNSITVSTQVDLQNNGRIQLGTHNLRLSSAATLVGYDNVNHVITNGTGSLVQTASPISGMKVFPVGNSSYNPAFLTNSGTTDEFSVRVEDLVYQQGVSGLPETNNIVDRTWYVDEDAAGGSNVDLTLRWNAADETATFDRTTCSVTHWDGGGWVTYGYSVANNVGSGYYEQTWPGLVSFSPFAVQDDNEPLPVTLLDFTAIRLDPQTARLDWSTADEVRNRGFAVERRLSNEVDFTQVGWVDGAGTSSGTTSYDFYDPNNWSGLSHYRLRQEDMDGAFTYSEVRTIRGLDGQPTITVWPNPVRTNLEIQFDHFGEETVEVQIWSTEGKQVFRQPVEVNGSQRLTITQTADLAAGMYNVQVHTPSRPTFTQKFLKLGD